MIIPDHEIRKRLDQGNLEISPIDKNEQIQPSSVDLRLGDTFITFDVDPARAVIDPFDDKQTYGTNIHDKIEGSFTLQAGQFVLADTFEYVRMPKDLVGQIHGRSSWARLAVIPHMGGWIDSGFEGAITLEILNCGQMPIKLKPQTRFCQMSLFEMKSPAEHPYDGKYQKQDTTAESKLHEENE